MKIKYLQPEVSDASEVLHLKLWEDSVFDYSLIGNICTDADVALTNGGYIFNAATSIILGSSLMDGSSKSFLESSSGFALTQSRRILKSSDLTLLHSELPIIDPNNVLTAKFNVI